MNKSVKKLKFLSNRYSSADYDYLQKLSDAEAQWLERFSREYFEGETIDLEQRKLANERRYSELEADALTATRPLSKRFKGEKKVLVKGKLRFPKIERQRVVNYSEAIYADLPSKDLNPEEIFLLNESVTEFAKKKQRSRL